MRADPRRVWFNQGLSNVYDAIAIIHRTDRSRELELLASHSLPFSPALVEADESWLEPGDALAEDEYVDWCLRTCVEREVDLFVPGRRRQAVARRGDEFERAGTGVLVAAQAEVLALFDRKDFLYEDLAGTSVAVPEFRTVRTRDEFAAAYQALRSRHSRICIKPASSIFGIGFHILEPREDEYERLTASDGIRVGVDAFRRALAQAKRPRDMVVMEYLPGLERSVDCLACAGRLITAVARVKHAGWQELETSGAAIEQAAFLAARYGLNGIFNVQTRDSRGEPHLLEINPRMSGGILYSCLSGLALPYWAVVLALGLRTPNDVPTPQGALALAAVSAAVTVAGTGVVELKSPSRQTSLGASK